MITLSSLQIHYWTLSHSFVKHLHSSSPPLNMMDDGQDMAGQDPSTHLILELRGTRFTIERETMMNLPESVLLCLFPNGLILTRQPRVPSLLDQDGEEDEEELYLVDFDPQCLSYVLSFFKTAQDEFYDA